MEACNMLTNAFSFFSNYSELSEDELKEQMEINGGFYTRTECVDKTEDIGKNDLDGVNHEKIISRDKILGFNHETGYDESFFEVIIEGEWTFESYKEAHIEKLNTLIIKNKHTIIQSLKSIYKDLAFPNKREVFLKTVQQIKGLKEIFNSANFYNNGLLIESLKEIFNSVKPFAQLYPDIASGEVFVNIEEYFLETDSKQRRAAKSQTYVQRHFSFKEKPIPNEVEDIFQFLKDKNYVEYNNNTKRRFKKIFTGVDFLPSERINWQISKSSLADFIRFLKPLVKNHDIYKISNHIFTFEGQSLGDSFGNNRSSTNEFSDKLKRLTPSISRIHN